MTLTGIAIIVLLGIIFLILEVLVLPGGIVGVIGFILMAIGVFYGYEIDTITGHYVLIISAVASIVLLILALRSNTWDRVALKNGILGKMNTLEEGTINKGDIGKSVTRLNPMGKARINGLLVEVKSFSSFIDENKEIRVVKVEGSSITVKELN